MIRSPSEKIITSLKSAIGSHKMSLTLADASAKSGLSLTETQDGLNFLVAEYRGNLAATSTGELLFSFPHGFSKPWEQAEKLSALWSKIKRSTLGILKFVVRAWISIVMVGYVVIFALILLAITFSSKNSDREESSSFSGGFMFHMMLRMLLDSLFWTFHPFSPYQMAYDPYFDQHRIRKPKVPFYERVNRFFFGPEEKPKDEQELFRLALQEIRAKKGRVGVLDIMRVTGLSKNEADPFMARLMLNHDGNVFVSEEGGIFYEFTAMRKSTLNEQTLSPDSIWNKKETVPPFTGNTAGSNMLITCLNGFNLIMSTVAISAGWTVEKLKYIFTVASTNMPAELIMPPADGPALLLGWIPLLFSSALFLIPLTRAFNRSSLKRKISNLNGKRGLLRTIFNIRPPREIAENELKNGWQSMADVPPSDRELNTEIARLGGDVVTHDDGSYKYKFAAIEAEMKALEEARLKASKKEIYAGDVIFSSAK